MTIARHLKSVCHFLKKKEKRKNNVYPAKKEEEGCNITDNDEILYFSFVSIGLFINHQGYIDDAEFCLVSKFLLLLQ